MTSDDIVTRLQTHRDIDNDRCCECGHWTSHDDDCMIGLAADEIERLRHQVDDLRRCLHDDQFVIKQLRAAGDALALASTLDLCDCSNDDCMALRDAHRTWTEARQ